MEKKTICFLVYPEMTLLDLVGPLQVLQPLQNFLPLSVVTVGQNTAPIPTDTSLSVQPQHSFEEFKDPYAIVVPGGLFGTFKAMMNDDFMAYVTASAQSAEIVASVCTGSLILASAGLLEGRKSTTHWAFLDALERFGAHPVRERWVEDGKFICAAGVSAGIDMALALTTRLADETTARMLQALIEYDPKPPLGPIDWDWIQSSQLAQMFIGPVTPALLSIVAQKPDLANKLLPQ